MSKNSVSEDPSRGIMINGSKHICNLTDSSFTYLLITVKVFEFQKASFGDMENLATFSYGIDKYCLLNRKNL